MGRHDRSSGDVAAVELLQEVGKFTRPDVRNQRHETALDIAKRRGDESMMQLLQSWRAKR